MCCMGQSLLRVEFYQYQNLQFGLGCGNRNTSFGKCTCGQSLSHVWLFLTPWTVACQAPLSIGFSRQEYWSGLPFPPPGYLPDPGIEPVSLVSLASVSRFFTSGGFPGGSVPGSRRYPGGGNGNPLQYSCLENPMDRGKWRATVHDVPKYQTP